VIGIEAPILPEGRDSTDFQVGAKPTTGLRQAQITVPGGYLLQGSGADHGRAYGLDIIRKALLRIFLDRNRFLKVGTEPGL
jgi:hypothetical protein